MVQPLPPTPANGRPDLTAGRPPVRPLTTGKYEHFRAYLQPLSPRPGADPGSPSNPQKTESEEARSKREMSLEPELPRSLAPEDQPSLGGGVADPAEWLSLINPMGGVEPPPLAAPPTATHAGVAEVAELVERWVRRVALGGDQRRGAVRLDIGQGRFSGAELLVVAEAGHVSVELQLPASVAGGDLSERLRARLEQRGYSADVLVR